MASAVATPLERQFGHIASVSQMVSTSQLGNTNITLQFDLNRNIDAAARDVQAAINAARGQLPVDLPGQPGYWKVNPADAPIMLLSMKSDNIALPEIYDAADSVIAQKLRQVIRHWRDLCGRWSASRGARAGESWPDQQLRHQPGNSTLGAELGQFKPAEGSAE